MSKTLLEDSLGISWYVARDDPDDLLLPVVELMERLHYRPEDLVLPPELPRFGRLDPPDWPACIRFWQTRGDGPELRKMIAMNQTRKVAIDHGLDLECPTSMERPSDEAA